MGRRSGRAAARRAAAALAANNRATRLPSDSPAPAEEPVEEDETMVDATEVEEQAEEQEAEEGEEQAPAEEEEEEEAAAEEEEEEAEEEAATEPSAKTPTPPPEPMVRRKRLGRPPKNRPPDWDNMIEVPAREADLPRRRGRGGYRGRGGRKGQPAPAPQQLDKDGNVLNIVDDEVELPEDPEGEKKVDKFGNLLGGRDYRCRTFTMPGRGRRLYMLSTEPARCVGFRDSYLFFTKHRHLYKIIVNDDEKRDMIERDIIPHSYKGRTIGIVTARSVFREFGALIIVGGRRIIDDYEVAKARAEGVVEGELADPNDHFVPGEEYNKNQYVAWHGASAVYHTSAPVVPEKTGKVESKRQRRVTVTDVNWMLEHAREASQFNSLLLSKRRAIAKGIYDVHTNQIMYPASMQPTHTRWEQVDPRTYSSAASTTTKTEPQQQPSPPSSESGDAANKPSASSATNLKPLPASIPRNYLVVDTYMAVPGPGVGAAVSARPQPPPPFFPPGTRRMTAAAMAAGDLTSPFTQGLSAVPDEIRALLPPECRAAFDNAVAKEREWSSKWGPEEVVGCRHQPVIDKAIMPGQVGLIGDR